MENSRPRTEADVPFRKLSGFALLGVPLAGVYLPLGVYLPPFYAQSIGMGVGTVGLIFMISRLWNALCDPMIGTLSDRTRTRFGRRKPWIFAGSLLFVASVAAIYWPSANITPLELGLSLFVLYLGWTMIGTPYSAWSGELSPDYHQRSRIQAFVQTATSIGLVLTLIIPAALDQTKTANPAIKIGAMGAFTLITFVPSILLLLFGYREAPVKPVSQPTVSIGNAFRAFATNRLVWRVMGSDFFVALGQGIRGSLIVFYVSAYMGLPNWAALLFLLQFVFGVFASPIWLRIGYRLGKHRTVVAGEITQIVINLGLLAIRPGDLWPLIALTVAQGLAQGSGNLMLRAIVGDVADYQRLKTGQEQSGLLFSIFNVTNNAAAAVAVGLSYPLIAWFGFVPGHANTQEALTGLALLFALGPATGHLLSALLIWRFPLNEARQTEIRRELDAANQSPAPATASSAFTSAPSQGQVVRRPGAVATHVAT